MGGPARCLPGLGRLSPELPTFLSNRPPWRSAPRAPNPSWTGSCGLWGRPTIPAASPVWCATVASMASLSPWMPPARSIASRTSTGQAASPIFGSGWLTLPIFIPPSCPSPSLSSFPPLALFLSCYPSLSLLRSNTIPRTSSVPSSIRPSLVSMVSPLQLRDLTTLLVPFPPPRRKFAPRCSVCGGAIMPEPGQEETVRIVALDRSFHIGCYKCEVRGPGQGEGEVLGGPGCCVEPRAPGLVESCSFCLHRSVGCCCPPRASVRAATHWTGTSCARRAVPGASRSSRPLSPLTAESFQKHCNTPPSHQPPSLTSAFTTLSPKAVSSSSDREIIIPQEFPKSL